MSDMYAIKESTLTALGDAVRLKTFGDYSQATTYSTTESQSHMIRLNYDYSKVIITFIEKVTEGCLVVTDKAGNGTKNYLGDGIVSGDVVELLFTGKQQVKFLTLYRPLIYSLQVIPVDENGNEVKYTPLEMVDAIEDFDTQSGQHFRTLLEGNESGLTTEDLAGMMRIGNYAFYMTNLTNIELPDTLTQIGGYAFAGTKLTHVDLPASVGALGTQSFYSCTNLKTAKIWNTTQKITGATSSSWPTTIEAIYVPSLLYEEYIADSVWKAWPLQPWGEWVFEPQLDSFMLLNQTKQVTIELSDFDFIPEVSVTSGEPLVASVSDVVVTNNAVTFNVNTHINEGSTFINVVIYGQLRTYEFSGNYVVRETIPESTYEVVAVDGASYGFALNDAGYWESQNKGQHGTAALCQININNLVGRAVYIDCINYGEANYDYGILGAVNQILVTTNADDTGVQKNFKGSSKADIQTVEYTNAIGSCTIQVKYKKDTSGDKNNDTLQFQVRFGE